MSLHRRSFLRSILAAGTVISLPINLPASFKKSLKFGLIADVHKDIMHDSDERLQDFVAAAGNRKLDFIMQLGDFCIPAEKNQGFMDIWNSYPGERHHVLGNHDNDGGYSYEDTLAFWKMPSKYYSFDRGGIHIAILDGNDPNPGEWEGYHRYIASGQQEWLRKDLASTDLPTLIFSHQTLEDPSGGVANAAEIRTILEEANLESGRSKIIACLCGHEHTDYHTKINGIYYIQINSASYRWVGGDHEVIRYSMEIDKKYPYIKKTIPYKDPLYTFIEIKPSGKLSMTSKISSFVGPGPGEMKLVELENSPIVARISARKLTP